MDSLSRSAITTATARSGRYCSVSLAASLPRGERHAHQVLAQAVMQILADAPLLAVADLGNLAFETLAGADVAEHDDSAGHFAGLIHQRPAVHGEPEAGRRVCVVQEHFGPVHRFPAHGSRHP